MDLREGVVSPSLASNQPSNPIAQVLKVAVIFVLAGSATYLLLTGPTHWVRFQYWLAHRGQANTATVYVDVNAPAGSFSGAVGAALSQPTFQRAAKAQSASQAIPKDLGLSDNHLLVPKINVNVPVIWNSSSDEKIMLANLQQGVAQYGFTSLPNPTTGNVFITGHSSYYWWDPGKFKTVFALLDRLTAGDQALIQFQGSIYVYKLRDKRVVKPSQVDITDVTKEPILSLMTCTPVGTSLNRLVARFDLEKVYSVDGAAPAKSVTPNKSPAPSTGEPTVPSPRDVIELVPGLR